MASTATIAMSAESFAALPDRGVRQELIRGELIEMPPPKPEHGDLMLTLGLMLRDYVRQQGGAVLVDVGFKLERDPDTVRAPDLAYLPPERANDRRSRSYLTYPPTLAVEVVSSHDRATALVEKAQWWLTHGVAVVWVVEPQTRTITTYRPDGSAHVYQHDQTLDGGDVLPGLKLPLADVFA